MKRAGLFAAGLLLLWVSVQLLPNSELPDETYVYSDEAGTVATRTEPQQDASEVQLLTPGNALAVLVLVGGIALAVYLRRRTGRGDGSAPIKPLGEYAIGPNQSLRLVECAGEVLLIGVTSGQVNLIRSYPVDTFDQTRPGDHPVNGAETTARTDLPPTGSHFADVLHRYAGSHIESNGTTC